MSELLGEEERVHEVDDGENAQHEPDDAFGTAHAACFRSRADDSSRATSVSGPMIRSQALTNSSATAKTTTSTASIRRSVMPWSLPRTRSPRGLSRRVGRGPARGHATACATVPEALIAPPRDGEATLRAD